MNIDVKDTLILDDNNEYVVVSKINYENKNYYYLIDTNEPDNLMICYEDKLELVELNDKELTTRLLPLFLEASKDIINELMNENFHN